MKPEQQPKKEIVHNSEKEVSDILKGVEVSRGTVENLENLPPKSIALDGYVAGPAVDMDTERISFDHHGECVRLVTRATCQQVMDALLLGFDPSEHTLYVNDVDGDSALSVWLLKNPSRIAEEQVRRLIETVGMRDAHGPAYPVQDQELSDAFFQGALGFLSELHRNKEYANADLKEVLATALQNIDRLLDGTLEWSPRPERERQFDITHTGESGWVMAKSEDPIFDLLYAEGYTKAIAYKTLQDGSTLYTVGRKSDLVARFDVPAILKALNDREPGWGGGSTIGGSPRNPDGSASRLTPEEVFTIAESVAAHPNDTET